MKDERARVFGRIRAALAGRATRTPMPDYADAVAASRADGAGGADLGAAFAASLERCGGHAFDDAGALGRWLAARGRLHGYCDPALLEAVAPSFPPAIALETRFARARVDDYAFGITAAAGAIAETGTIILGDRGGARRLAALAPWIHVAVVRRGGIHRRVIDAIRALPPPADDPNVVWCTGPSKTADVEGILIEGVHGPGCQVALVVP